MAISGITNAIKLITVNAQSHFDSIFPVHASRGVILTESNQVILVMNQERDSTPLSAAEQDRFVKQLAEILNKNRASFESAMRS